MTKDVVIQLMQLMVEAFVSKVQGSRSTGCCNFSLSLNFKAGQPGPFLSFQRPMRNLI
jgi:hypothetical protein